MEYSSKLKSFQSRGSLKKLFSYRIVIFSMACREQVVKKFVMALELLDPMIKIAGQVSGIDARRENDPFPLVYSYR